MWPFLMKVIETKYFSNILAKINDKPNTYILVILDKI